MSKARDRYKVLVKREDLKTKGLNPSSQEIYDLMHITTCELVEARWKDAWSFCPVCCAMIDEDGCIRHRTRQEIQV